MRVLIDICIIIDALQPRKPFKETNPEIIRKYNENQG